MKQNRAIPILFIRAFMAYKKGETYWYFFSELKNRGAE
jgi:hypothetical protein